MKSAPSITVQLIHIQGGLKGQIQEFSTPVITIGRLPSLTLNFPATEPGVSREHARIQRDGNQFRLVALHDKFGTFVNGKKVREALLQNGDVIEFGSGGPKVSFNAQLGEPTAEPLEHRINPEPAAALPGEPPSPKWCDWAQNAPPVSGERRPVEEAPDFAALSSQRTCAPLIIQFGPTIRTFHELPVLIGAHVRCDYPLQHSGILDQQAQILFSEGCYYVKDLTGQRLVSVNGSSSGTPVRLNRFDELSLGAHGPVFQFLGEGRLAELEASSLRD
jgi:predicted component of type VI protein secretion system